MEQLLEVKKITKDYGNGKGVFDVSFSVHKGEVLGFLGPNGAGKTTTIRQLMGFIRSDSGQPSILGQPCFPANIDVLNKIGYLPGEIAFMDDMKGRDFIRFIGHMRGMNDFSRAEELMEYFELDPRGKISKMSKGMKQKIGIVIAFMHDPEIYILDEPTSGLDPLMQNKFVELIRQEKEKGKSILMSSHIFEEIEKTCDRTVIIRAGKVVAIEDMSKLRENKTKQMTITFGSPEAAAFFGDAWSEVSKHCKVKDDTVTVRVGKNLDHLIKLLGKHEVKDIAILSDTLEDLFMHFYENPGGEQNDK